MLDYKAAAITKGSAVAKVLSLLRAEDNKGNLRLTDAWCTTLKVQNVPPKPSIANAPEWKETLEAGTGGLANFTPLRVSDVNVGSNAGLMRLMRNIFLG